MINIKYINMRLDRFIPLLTAILLISSCSRLTKETSRMKDIIPPRMLQQFLLLEVQQD